MSDGRTGLTARQAGGPSCWAWSPGLPAPAQTPESTSDVEEAEKGGVNAAVFIEFLKRLMAGAKRAIFLIVDRGPAHIAKKTRAFVDSQHGRLRLFFLPPYSPDRNPDELVWKHLKADTVGRMTITDKADFKAKVRASMRQLQNDPEKIRSFYQKPLLKYAA